MRPSPSTTSRAPAPVRSPGAQIRAAIRSGSRGPPLNARTSSASVIHPAVQARVNTSWTALTGAHSQSGSAGRRRMEGIGVDIGREGISGTERARTAPAGRAP